MPELNEAVIISAVRTPVGQFLGSLKGFSAPELGAIVVRESVKRAGIKPEDVDEVIDVLRDHFANRCQACEVIGTEPDVLLAPLDLRRRDASVCHHGLLGHRGFRHVL